MKKIQTTRKYLKENYFNDTYQGIPIGGYTKIIEKMLEGIEVRLKNDFFKSRTYSISFSFFWSFLLILNKANGVLYL